MESTPSAKSFFKGKADKEIPAHRERKMTDLYACITLHGEEGATEEQKAINTS